LTPSDEEPPHSREHRPGVSISAQNPLRQFADRMEDMSLIADLKENKMFFVQQKKELAEIVLSFETANRYIIMTPSQQLVGFIAERSEGFLTVIKRLLLKSHRGFEVEVTDSAGGRAFHLRRGFFFFFSDLFVYGEMSQLIGSIHRRFGLLTKKYDLKDSMGRVFATIKSPVWRLWTFPIADPRGLIRGAEITKKWGGVLKEVFTDTDTYCVNFGENELSVEQKAIILAAAISIDFDFFENNQGNHGVFG
jgi:uncharacterized protein YxjI